MRAKVGDEVKLASKFLRSIGNYDKEAADRVGKVLEIEKVGKLSVAMVEWRDDPENPKRVLCSNLWPAKELHLEPR